jgi:hypothetical protein
MRPARGVLEWAELGHILHAGLSTLGLAREAGKPVQICQSHSTTGQARILEFATRGHRRLVAYKPTPDKWVYEIIELSGQSAVAPRFIMTVTSVMVKSLVDVSWIERAGRIDYRNGYWYRVTESGLDNRWGVGCK